MKAIARSLGMAVAGFCLVVFIREVSEGPDLSENADLGADAIRACQEKFIPPLLANPTTAKYSNVMVSESSSVYAVTGSVETQDGSGTSVQAKFLCSVTGGPGWIPLMTTVH